MITDTLSIFLDLDIIKLSSSEDTATQIIKLDLNQPDILGLLAFLD
jgi:hypothetical protein